MTIAPQTQQKSVNASRAATAAQAATQAAPDYVETVKKSDAAITNRMGNNAVYKLNFAGDMAKEERMDRIVEYITKGLRDGSAKQVDWTKTSGELDDLIAAIQVLSRQLAGDQADEITGSAQADYQRILEETTGDVATYEGELAPLIQLAQLLAKYGADGNIVVKINDAKARQAQRKILVDHWWENHNEEVRAFEKSIRMLKANIEDEEVRLHKAWTGKAHIQATIDTYKAQLTAREAQLEEARQKQPDVVVDAEQTPEVDADILELQNIGGPRFKQRMIELRDNTRSTLAKMSVNFDIAGTCLMKARESFTEMDRNYDDAILALSILEVAVKRAEAIAREVAAETVSKPITSTGDNAELDRMEHEHRSQQILGFTANLTTFVENLAVAVSGLRKSQDGVKTILQMNGLCLKSVNIHKVTGMTNMTHAATISIGNLVDLCNRAAGRVLVDGLNHIQEVAEEGNRRLTGSASETILQQNIELGDFVKSMEQLTNLRLEITKNSVDALREQYALVQQMHDASGELGAATADGERVMFSARAGVIPTTDNGKPVTDAPVEGKPFSLRMGGAA